MLCKTHVRSLTGKTNTSFGDCFGIDQRDTLTLWSIPKQSLKLVFVLPMRSLVSSCFPRALLELRRKTQFYYRAEPSRDQQRMNEARHVSQAWRQIEQCVPIPLILVIALPTSELEGGGRGWISIRAICVVLSVYLNNCSITASNSNTWLSFNLY